MTLHENLAVIDATARDLVLALESTARSSALDAARILDAVADIRRGVGVPVVEQERRAA